jgi:hypothetical protein
MLFSKDDLDEALRTLVSRLVAADVEVRIRLLGGAAMAVAYGREALTEDVDAAFGAEDRVRRVVESIADERGWPRDWLNNKAQGFMSHFNDPGTWVPYLEQGGVVVSVCPADELLAMKLRAGRGRRDAGDIELLLAEVGVESSVQAEELFDRFFPEDEMGLGAVRLLAERFPEG